MSLLGLRSRFLRLSAALILAFSFFLDAWPMVASANSNFNLTVGGATGYNPTVDGSSWWDSSNLREFLNSSAAAGQVAYTGAAPSTASSEGFLHEFTTTDQNAIAVTRHRVNYTPAYSSMYNAGNSSTYASNVGTGQSSSLTFSIPNLLSGGANYAAHLVNDKVFLLSAWDVYQYLQKRGYSMDRTLTSQATALRGVPDDDHWWTGTDFAPLSNWDTVVTIADEKNAANYDVPCQSEGVVPALNLKPTASVGGTLASNLTIGQTVNFGQFLGVPVEWQVVNKQNGYALLIATHAIDEMEYDAQESAVPVNSNTINYSSADVDYSNDPYTPTHGTTDTTPPTLTVTNSSALTQRQNGSYALNFSATDDSSGVAYTLLPDGTKTTATSFSYKIKSNGYYVFKTVDKAGNFRNLTVPISNINPPSNIIVSQSSSDWTTQPVSVTITSDNQVGTTVTGVQNYRDNVSYLFPNYTSYNGKSITISGAVSFNSSNINLSNNLQIGFMYDTLSFVNGEFNLNRKFQPEITMTLAYIKAHGTVGFNQTFTVPSDFAMDLYMWSNLPIVNTGDASITWNPLAYQLNDVSDFTIKSITLPNGQTVNAASYTGTLNQAGTYIFTIIDNRGQTTQETVTVKIDTSPPTLTVSGNPTSTVHSPVTLTAQAVDSQSGVQAVKTPDGVWHTSNSVSYKVLQNGSYTFQSKDAVGNVSTQTVTVSNMGSLLWINQTPSTSLSASTSDNGKSQTLNFSTGAFGVQDNRGSGTGWHVTMQASRLSGHGHTLPANTLQVGTPSISGSDGTVGSPLGSYQAIDAGSAVSVASAASGKGTGSYTINAPLRVTAPASAYAGSYQTTVTEDLVSAP
ncbi:MULTISPECIES: DUF6273 domain-containing protein [unclassified Sporolactobacillus]|uniref:DUF6273 domain-containing protein n=1 Tax=unclassified Sporolactobacillus TaxID=2628533 RepID=UPI0023684991|nr:DUF6273 domain-containing protein [Sporolactobacillus sp. CQH2019]MDD9150454.1 DUF6273 domain-containing protein [Sporolactobacillus sp. CQH2019]